MSAWYAVAMSERACFGRTASRTDVVGTWERSQVDCDEGGRAPRSRQVVQAPAALASLSARDKAGPSPMRSLNRDATCAALGCTKASEVVISI